MFFAILSAEGGMRGFKEFLEGEDLIDQYTVTRTLTRFPTRLFKCLGWVRHFVIVVGRKNKAKAGLHHAAERTKNCL